MRYLRVHWDHDHPGEPVTLYSELDDEGREIRKVEVFADGATAFAGPDAESGSTFLALEPLPPIEEIAADPQFRPQWIARPEFERAWEGARRVGRAEIAS